MDRIQRAIENVKVKDWYRDQIEHIEELPEKEPKHGEADLTEEMETFLDERNIELYTHQAKAVNHVKNGENIVITTPTASGKTLAFNIPVLEKLRKDEEATALYIYPTKALSNDQLETLRAMETGLDTTVNPAVYDGDTARDRKRKIRKTSRLIITNPYGLHHYLPWHSKWKRFFENLEFVVLDEVHNYRGVFGSNVAMVVRRLKRILDHYGADPQFILSSATIANPDELSTNLTGENFEIVSQDGSGSGKKYFVFWNPLKYPDNSIHVQTSNLLTHMVEENLQTLAFTVSRRMAELVSKWSDENSSNHTIKAYRAGYLPEERREIEKGLRTGEVDGAVSTNALELGVDIGGLDTVLISGYPGTIVSTWQQAGRAGRGEEESSAFLLAFENPLDQYFMKHPEKFFGKSPEHAIIDLENPNIAMGHLTCAAAELPLNEDEDLAESYPEELDSLEKQGVLHKTPAGYVYAGEARPVETVQLDNISQETIKVLHEGEVLETMDSEQAYREAHENAVLLHQGETYVVKELDLEKNVAHVEKEDVDYYTEAISQTDIQVLDTQADKEKNGILVKFGDVVVSEHYLKYKLMKYDQVVGLNTLDLPPINFETEATWIEIPSEISDEVEERDLDLEGGIHAVEHALIAMTPFHAMCDRWDIGGVSSTHHPDTEQAAVFLYDAYEGGIGIARKSFDLIKELLKTTHELVKDCDCEEGCPSCIHSPKCGNGNDPLDKEAAIHILSELLKETP